MFVSRKTGRPDFLPPPPPRCYVPVCLVLAGSSNLGTENINFSKNSYSPKSLGVVDLWCWWWRGLKVYSLIRSCV